MASRAERAETEEARLKGHLEQQEAGLAKKDGQVQRLVTTCTVLEQKLRALMAKGGGTSAPRFPPTFLRSHMHFFKNYSFLNGCT